MNTPEREKFEKWAETDGQYIVSPNNEGVIWKVWQAALSAAPTPPDHQHYEEQPDGTVHALDPSDCNTPPEVEPVYAAMDYKTQEYAYIRTSKHNVEGWITLQHQSRDDVTYFLVELFTSPPSHKAEEAGPIYQARWNEAARWSVVSLEYYLAGPATFKRKIYTKTKEDKA